MLYQPYSCVVLVEPVHASAVDGEVGVEVATIHCAPVVVVLFNVRIEIKFCDPVLDGVESFAAVCCKHYYLCFVFRVFFLR
jgi:hypothetical protein